MEAEEEGCILREQSVVGDGGDVFDSPGNATLSAWCIVKQ